jgi:hypothetical protein
MKAAERHPELQGFTSRVVKAYVRRDKRAANLQLRLFASAAQVLGVRV